MLLALSPGVNASLQLSLPTASVVARTVEAPCRPTTLALERETAIALDEVASEQLEIGVLWNQLAAGRWLARDQFVTKSRLYILVEAQVPPLEPLEVDLLRRTLLGERQKVVALDRDVSPSTVTNRISHTLARMGLPPRPARVPVVLVAAAAAALENLRLPQARITRWVELGAHISIISVARFGHHLEAVLTPAEWSVATLVIDGYSHREIAARRECSTRTVANQIGSIFRKLNVSGRPELLIHAISGSSRG